MSHVLLNLKEKNRMTRKNVIRIIWPTFDHMFSFLLYFSSLCNKYYAIYYRFNILSYCKPQLENQLGKNSRNIEVQIIKTFHNFIRNEPIISASIYFEVVKNTEHISTNGKLFGRIKEQVKKRKTNNRQKLYLLCMASCYP